MARFADRLLTRCDPVRVSSLLGMQAVDEFLRSQVLAGIDHPTTSEGIELLSRDERARYLAKEPVSRKHFDPSLLNGVPIVAADDVAVYASSLPDGTNMADVVASMAPAFDRFFIEFQAVPRRGSSSSWAAFLGEFSAWGALVTADQYSDRYGVFEEDDGAPRWILTLLLFLEREKGKPFGPAAEHVLGLAEDGTWFRHANGSNWWAGGAAGFFEPDLTWDLQNEWGDRTAQLLFPVLLAISFMHCKNVQLREESPAEALSRKHRRKHGRELVRFHTLEIEPLRRLLDQHRSTGAHGLRNALHICRGHFKTFSPEAPLLGRHTGTYWWAPHLRGTREEGVVAKDYRINAPIDLGRAYREADEVVEEITKEAPLYRDPDSVGRGRAAHNRTQNCIAAVIRELGWLPRSPKPEEPEFDLAWSTDVGVFVCEVKSLTAQNEERQLRMAIGQVIRYRQKLAAAGHEPMTAVIATETTPIDVSWDQLCRHEGILLIWPEVAKTRIESAVVTLRSCA
jgi:hypothetical protein